MGWPFLAQAIWRPWRPFHRSKSEESLEGAVLFCVLRALAVNLFRPARAGLRGPIMIFCAFDLLSRTSCGFLLQGLLSPLHQDFEHQIKSRSPGYCILYPYRSTGYNFDHFSSLVFTLDLKVWSGLGSGVGLIIRRFKPAPGSVPVQPVYPALSAINRFASIIKKRVPALRLDPLGRGERSAQPVFCQVASFIASLPS